MRLAENVEILMTSKMKLWKVTNNTVTGYDTYDAVIVAAETEEEARMIHPSTYEKNWDGKVSRSWAEWGAAKDNTVEYIGTTDREIPKGVILASFNAG